MTYRQFVSLYGDLIYAEWRDERVYDELGMVYDTYLKMKYENFMEAVKGILPHQEDAYEDVTTD